jgi:hypothetical protein
MLDTQFDEFKQKPYRRWAWIGEHNACSAAQALTYLQLIAINGANDNIAPHEAVV